MWKFGAASSLRHSTILAEQVAASQQPISHISKEWNRGLRWTPTGAEGLLSWLQGVPVTVQRPPPGLVPLHLPHRSSNLASATWHGVSRATGLYAPEPTQWAHTTAAIYCILALGRCHLTEARSISGEGSSVVIPISQVRNWLRKAETLAQGLTAGEWVSCPQMSAANPAEGLHPSFPGQRPPPPHTHLPTAMWLTAVPSRLLTCLLLETGARAETALEMWGESHALLEWTSKTVPLRPDLSGRRGMCGCVSLQLWNAIHSLFFFFF